MKIGLKEALEGLIEKFGEDEEKLWAVISALRGPDDMDVSLKSATTAIIRDKIGIYPNTVQGHTDVARDTESAVSLRVKSSTEWINPHFVSHAKSAFYFLGLKWEEKN